MKKLCVMLLAAMMMLLAAPIAAQAYAIYNHMDHWLCVQTDWSHNWGDCKYVVEPHGHHNGAHGSGMRHVWFTWNKGNTCHTISSATTIPKGGFARTYDDRVEIWKHCDKCTSKDHIHTRHYKKYKCNPNN